MSKTTQSTKESLCLKNPKVGQRVIYRNHVTGSVIKEMEIRGVYDNFVSASLAGSPESPVIEFRRKTGIASHSCNLSITNDPAAVMAYQTLADPMAALKLFNRAVKQLPGYRGPVKTSRRDAGATGRKA